MFNLENKSTVADAGGSDSAVRGGAKLLLDVERVACEAEELMRMSIGGVTVVGAYLVASKAALQAAQPRLRELIASIRASGKQMSIAAAESDLVLLLVDSASLNVVTAFRCSAGGSTSVIMFYLTYSVLLF